EIPPDLLHIGRLALVGECRVAGDYQAPRKSGKIGGQIVGDAVSEIFRFDRLAKGNTTIDRRAASSASGGYGRRALAAAGAWTGTAVGFPLGHAHQTAIPIAITAAKLPPIAASRGVLKRGNARGCAGAATSGSDPTVAAL